MKLRCVLPALLIVLGGVGTAAADSLAVEVNAGPSNPASPQMGDNLSFRSRIRNGGDLAVDGLVAWISLIEIDPGNEQPIDLEDWSAHKVETVAKLPPGATVETDWPLRLIQSGRYRIVIHAMSRDTAGLVASPFVDFTVREKRVVESQRVLPVALGVPLLMSLIMFWRWRRQR